MITFAVFLAAFSLLRAYIEAKPAPAAQLLRVAWFVCVTLFEWSILRHQPWLPTFLGGPGGSAILEKSWEADLTFLYQLQLGYHTQSMLFSLYNGAKPEMHLHHATTLLLVTFSYVFGYLRYGAVVFFLHDIPDISGYLMKAAVEAQAKRFMMLAFTLLVLTWGYCRLVLFCQTIYVLYVDRHMVEAGIFASHMFMLSLLLCLHYYWYILFFKMAFSYKTKGLARDISEVRSLGELTSREQDKPHAS